MFGPWLEIFAFFKGLVPAPSKWRYLKPPSLNFITLHYMYMLLTIIVCSVILYGARNMAYIDALFFASGAATQSGLNTINVNDILLYQQVTIMLICSVTNPIFINTFVVFVRLYWFEKRFQNIVREAQKWRRTRERATIPRTRGQSTRGLDGSEEGVGSRKISVLHADVERLANSDSKQHSNAVENYPSGSDSSVQSEKGPREREESPEPGPRRRSTAPPGTSTSPGFHRDITFADEVKPNRQRSRRDSSSTRMPLRRPAEQHIAFVEQQRIQDSNHDNEETLYIPGPRDWDSGALPSNLKANPTDSNNLLKRISTTETFPHIHKDQPNSADPTEEINGDDHPVKTDNQSRQHLHFGNPFANVGYSVFSHFKSRALARHGSAERNEDEKDTDASLRRRGRQNTFRSFLSTESILDDMPYLSYQPTVARNSRFVNLTEEQREELGGIEYRALKALAVILCCYFVGFHLLGLLSFLPWIVRSSYVSLLEEDGVSPAWWGVFTPASCFNDLGFTLTPDSMYSFNYAVWPLLIGSFLIIIGNTGFPCMLRFVVWTVSKLVRRGTPYWEELRFLLDHPRRCFTLLFPSTATWWLFWVLVLLNGIDLIFFIILDLHDPVVSDLPAGIRVLDGWFQAASTRTAGFSVVNIANLHPGIQVSYLIMMYISVFPIAISVRRTNVYEEKSLGIYQEPSEEQEQSKVASFVGTHLRRQLSFDLWYVFLGLFIISIVEGARLGDLSQTSFTLFAVLFEIVSAYGTVGLSLGYPNVDTSFSAQFRILSKLVIIAMQIRGRHRGLPYALDKAILLPSESLHRKEHEEADRIAAGLELGRPTSALSSPRSEKQVNGTIPFGVDGRSMTTRTARSTDTSRGKMGLSRLISSALSAGPSIHKRD